MRCRHARIAIVERGLGLLPAEAHAALDLHLRGCPGCSAAVAHEQRIVSDLRALRGEFPFELDVTPRVMSHVASRRLPLVPDFTARQFGWCAALAVAAALALIVTGWGLVPAVEPIAREVGSTTASFFGFFERLAGVALGLLSIPFKLLGVLLRSAFDLVPVLHKLRPLATGSAILAMLVMMTTIAYFVGRDWIRQDPAPTARSETR